MKILLVVDQMSCGGIESWLITIIKALKERGHEPVAFPMSRSGALLEQLEATGVRIRSITEDVKDLGFFKPRMIRAFRRIVREENPDVVHLCDIISGHIGRIACLGLGVPVMYHIRSVVPHGKWKYRVAASLLSFVTTRFLAVSHVAARKVVRTENLAGKPCTVLHNCIDIQRFDVVPSFALSSFFPDAKSRLILVTCGRLVPLKNIDLVIRAMVGVRAHCPTARLLILGDGPERARLEVLTRELDLAQHVVFTGFREDVPSILKGLGKEPSVFLMPSDYEGFSNALSEALYCGLPAVISDKVPNAEMTGDAALVVKRDARAISEAVLRIASDERLFAHMRSVAREKASDLTPDNYVTRLLSAYQGA